MALAQTIDLAPTGTGARRGRARELASILGPPVLLFALVEIALCLTVLGAGGAPLDASVWAHWDSINYLQIVTRGYERFDCSARGLGAAGVTCGNGAWFPGIAWLTALFGVLGATPTTTMLVLARLFTLGTLVLVWVGLLDARRTPSSYAALAFAAVCPGSVWFHAQFPMSMATFGIVGALVAVRRGRVGWAAAAGFLAATAYTTAVLATPFLVAWMLLARNQTRLSLRVERAGIVGGGFLAGGLSVLVVMRLQSGTWDVFFRAQDRYAYVHRFPPSAWWERTRPLLDGAVGVNGLTAAQTGFVGLLVVGCVAWGVRHRVRGIEATVLAYALCFWLFPLYQGALSNYRSDALLLPLAVVVARLRAPLAIAVTAVSAALVLPLTAAYVTNNLI